MPTLVLVDGSSYLYRAFHALPDLRTSQGEPTGALRGVLAMLRRMVEDGKPDYFAVVFDAPGKTFRDDWYPEYKANRPPMPDDLVRQLEPLQELVRANGWPLLVVDGVEADDVIGTLAKAAKRDGIDTLISTSDKDLAQLVEPGVTCVNTMSNETLDPEGVVAKFGVRPDQVLDLLALTGDAVDNVPGVPKVGPKTAAKWLAQYGSLDNIVAHAADIGGVVGENLRASLDWLPKGRQLLTVKTDCELPVGPRDLAISAVDRAKLAELYGRFEFKSWLRDLAPGAAPAASAADSIAAKAARDDTGRRFDQPAHARRRGQARRPGLRGRADAGGARALDRATSTPRRSPASTPRPRASTRWATRSSACRSASSRAGPATCRSRTATRARPTSSTAPRCSRGSRRGSPARGTPRSGRTSSSTSTRSPTTASRSPASRTTRCSSPTCSSRTSPTTWTASRGGTSTGRRSPTPRCAARARRRSASTR